MSNYLKYFIVLLVVLLSSFIVTKVKTTPNSDELIKADLAKEDEFKIVAYPKEQTQKVSHKLDSLFNRMNKR